jgi:hypothetical protein
MNKIAVCFLWLTISFGTSAQKIEFGLGLGVSHFKGDISPKFNPLQLGFGGQALGRYHVGKGLALRANLLFSTYSANDNKTKDAFYIYRAASAKGNILEAAALAEYNFFNQHNRHKKVDFTPYLFGGLGYGLINNTSNQSSGGVSASSIVIPYGVGLKYRFSGPWSISTEMGSRYTLTDNMDLYFSNFGNKNTSAATGAINDKLIYGDLSRNDLYLFTSFSLTYTIFDIVCPE